MCYSTNGSTPAPRAAAHSAETSSRLTQGYTYYYGTWYEAKIVVHVRPLCHIIVLCIILQAIYIVETYFNLPKNVIHVSPIIIQIVITCLTWIIEWGWGVHNLPACTS